MPSALRDLFGFRLAMRCTTPQASDTILGQGWASAGADASSIPGAQRGVGYLLAEGERPIRLRGFYLDDDDVAAIAERAAARRADRWLAEGVNGMSAIAMTAPAPVLERRPRSARADPDEWERFERQLRSNGYCRRPVRLRGRVDSLDARQARSWPSYSTEHEPDGTLLKCCGNRREAVCPSCARTYRGDAFQLVASGMRGGKGVPETVAEHPMVFLTLTAPSFGPVHSRRVVDGKARRCRPRRDGEVCPHGVVARVQRGPRRGRPAARRAALPGVLRLRARGAVERARARAVAAHRDPAPARARAAAAASARSGCGVRVSYVKVAEFQRRGALHFHCVLRLDGVERGRRARGAAGRVTARSC